MASMAVGVVVEGRAIQHRWRGWRWSVVEGVPGLGVRERWRPRVQGAGGARDAAGAPALELHRKATEDYRLALSATPPQLYVVLRAEETRPVPFVPFLVTASPWEAQAYDGGDDLVDAVAMPEPIAAWIDAFVAEHHVDQPFFKRRRKGRGAAADAASEFVSVEDGHGR